MTRSGPATDIPFEDADDPLWVVGVMTFRVRGLGAEPDRVVTIPRPFGLIGLANDSDIRINDPSLNARHTYLHLDPRGVFAVDLATRAGTAVGAEGTPSGWLAPGDTLQVAGRTIELVRAEIDGTAIAPPPCDDDLLGDAKPGRLTSVSLAPKASPEIAPWELGSPLVFVGWSGSCGLQVKDEAASKIHCVFVRTADAAYLVDFCGRRTRLDGRQVQGASILEDGQTLTIGSTDFLVRLVPSKARKARGSPTDDAPPLVARVIHHEVEVEAEVVDSTETNEPRPAEPSNGLANLPAESRHEMIAWMVDAVREAQLSAQRQREEMSELFGEVVRQIQQGNAVILEAHLERIEKIDRELVALRAEISQKFPSQLPAPPPSPASLPPPPDVAPLQIPREIPHPANPNAAATWLLERVGRLEDKNRSAWKDLMNRIATPPKGDR